MSREEDLLISLERATKLIGELSLERVYLVERLRNSYSVGTSGELIHNLCGQEGVGVEGGELVASCECSPRSVTDSKIADSEVKKEQSQTKEKTD